MRTRGDGARLTKGKEIDDYYLRSKLKKLLLTD